MNLLQQVQPLTLFLDSNDNIDVPEIGNQVKAKANGVLESAWKIPKSSTLSASTAQVLFTNNREAEGSNITPIPTEKSKQIISTVTLKRYL